jgi:hypothetical protein
MPDKMWWGSLEESKFFSPRGPWVLVILGSHKFDPTDLINSDTHTPTVLLQIRCVNPNRFLMVRA